MAEEVIIEKSSPKFTKVILAILISAIIFGLLGYYLGITKTQKPVATYEETAR